MPKRTTPALNFRAGVSATCRFYLDTPVNGSPCLQNGMLIGAVSHVLVDSPARGCGIFAETMPETARSIAEEELKEAS